MCDHIACYTSGNEGEAEKKKAAVANHGGLVSSSDS
jgi:hypothetical protein